MKKIDTKKSLILGIREKDTEGLGLGTHGYFSRYRDFRNYVEGNLDGFTRTEFMSIQEHSEGHFESQWYDYFIPTYRVVFVEEKKYRPFKDLKEFINTTGYEISDIVTFRRKRDSSTEYNVLFFGHLLVKGITVICLGSGCYSFEELLRDFLYYKDGVWLPFGVEE